MQDNQGTNQTGKWRPRFSLRTLAILLTLICIYFGAWELTKRIGMPLSPAEISYERQGELRTFRMEVANESSPMPFIIGRDEGSRGGYSVPVRHYYIWFFGAEWKLPFEQPQ